MFKVIIRFIPLLFVFFTSCTSEYDFPKFPKYQWPEEKIKLAVRDIKVIDNYIPSLKKPNAEYVFPISPSAALKSWSEERLQEEGDGKAYMKVIINDASVIEESLKKTEGLKGAFTKDQEALYRASLQVKLEIYENDPVFPKAEININVKKARSVREDDSLNDRDRIFYNLVHDLIKDFDREAEREMNNYFIKYLYQGQHI